MEFQVACPILTYPLESTISSNPSCGLRATHTFDGVQHIPNGYPAKLDQSLAWTGSDFARESDFIYSLTEVERTEVRRALEHFQTFELDGDLVKRANFPLPTLGPELECLSQEIYNGRGFCVIRGIKPADYSPEDQTVVWLGIQAYMADQRGRQDHQGNMLVHIVADNSDEIKMDHHRHSTQAITFHNEEAGDVISWLTRSTAATGGKCVLAPVYMIYNVLAAHRPDMIRTLARSDWPFALPHFQCRPLIFYHDSRLMMNFGRTPLLGNAAHPRPKQLPKLNDSQREALDMVEAIAQAVQVEIKTQAGDMHFINNFAILHRREGFADGAAAQDKRHLVRMRLRSSRLGWSIPEDLKKDWDDAFDEDGPFPTWHIDPMPGDAFPLRKYTN